MIELSIINSLYLFGGACIGFFVKMYTERFIRLFKEAEK